MLCVGGKKRDELLESAARAMDGAEMRLHVSQMTAETIDDVDGTTFTVYRVQVTLLGEKTISWEVARRYSEFHDLHKLMKSLGVVLADLPSKNPFAHMNAVKKSRSGSLPRPASPLLLPPPPHGADDAAACREAGLRDYLNVVLGHCNDGQCQLLSRFLRVNRNLRGTASSTPSMPSTPLPARRAPLDVPSESRMGHPASGQLPQSMPGAKRSSPARRREKQLQPPLREVVAGVPHSSLRYPERYDLSASMHSTSTDVGLPAPVRFSSAAAAALERSMILLDDGVAEEDDDGGVDEEGSDAPREQRGSVPSCSSTPRRTPTQRRMMDSSKAGVGLFFVQGLKGGKCVVDEVIRGSSACRDGRVEVGDVLEEVDGAEVAGQDLSVIRGRIVGEPGTWVRLGLKRGGVRIAVELER